MDASVDTNRDGLDYARGMVVIVIAVLTIGSVGFFFGSALERQNVDRQTRFSEMTQRSAHSTDRLTETIQRFQSLYYCGPLENDGL